MLAFVCFDIDSKRDVKEDEDQKHYRRTVQTCVLSCRRNMGGLVQVGNAHPTYFNVVDIECT
jgi:hypothetical protein